jgi:phenylalanyl-tRNA synthetase alpha subunit
MDFEWEGDWFEWGGCGMIHPQVLRNCRIDPERYQGFAFGMGIDRTAMERFGVPSIQLLFDGDVRVVEQICCAFRWAGFRSGSISRTPWTSSRSG